VLMFPLLYYVPPLLGLQRLDAQTTAAVVISEVVFAALIGGIAHWRRGRVHSRLALFGGLSSAAGSFLGGIASKWVHEDFFLFLFGVVTLLAAVTMFFPPPTLDRDQLQADRVAIPMFVLSLLSFVVGVVVGFLGAGNFMFVPLLIYVLKVPVRVTIGSSLFIAMLNTFSGFLGKLITGQIPLVPAISVILGAGAGALAGERSHGWFSPRVLRFIYAVMVGVITLRVWLTILG